MNKSIDEKYQKRMINVFETYFIELYSDGYLNNLKIITKSLLFTLLPIHDNSKCDKYFNLIQSL